MRKIYVALLSLFTLFFWSSRSTAQISTYTFVQSVGTYTEISGGTILGNESSDDQYFVNPAIPLGGSVNTGPGFPIGFNFTYNGIVFDRFSVNNNGWIGLGQSALTPSTSMVTSSAYTPLSSTATNVPTYLRSRIAGFGRDIQAQTGAVLRFETIGTAPNRQLVVQFKNYKRFGTAGNGDNFNFQIILNETTAAVNIKYGTISWNTVTTSSTITHIGLGGTVSTDFNNRQTVAPHNWNTTIAGTTNAQGAQNATSTIAVIPPVSGTTFTYAPLSGPSMGAAGATLVTETCPPANGAIDVGEMVTVSFCVLNTGTTSTTSLVGTLLATGGVTAPSGPQNYGVVVNGGAAVCRDFTFIPAGICGGSFTASIQLQDGATNLGTVSYTFTLGLQNVAISQNFDALVAPALPAGWVTSQPINLPGAPTWVTSNAGTPAPAAFSAPNSIFSTDPANILDNIIELPAIAITSTSAQVSFRNNYSLETNFDGGVLEIAIGAGSFQDIIAAGGSFVSGGYNGTISGAFGNPIGGRQAWTGTSAGGFIVTTANLPAAAAGQNVRLRFRMGSDNSFAALGWRIDNVTVSNGFSCCTTCTITCPPNVVVSNDANQCGAVVTYALPTSSGTCGVVTATPASGSFFPVGLTTVTATSSVGGGRCTFTVRVNDTQLPVLGACPANIIRSNDPGQCGAAVTFTLPTATDNCPGTTVTASPASGSFFPRGTTTVNITATDASGNSTSCSFTVTVNDTQNPTFGSSSPVPERLYYKFDGTGASVPNLATAPPPGTATATLTSLTQGSTGKCGTALIGTGIGNGNMNTGWATNMSTPWTISFWLGANQVDNNPSYLFGDVTAGTFRAFYGGLPGVNNMMIRGGSGDITITGVNPGATFVTVVYNGTNTVVYKNGASPQTFAVTFANTGPGPFRVGGYNTTNLFSINGLMDEFGMYSRALSASEVLTLFNNCPSTASSCPANITVNNTSGLCSGVATYVAPVGVDNCPGTTTTQIAGLPSGGTYPVGVTTNTFRAVDASGNSTLCSFTVTVRDTQAPVITCPANITATTPVGSCTAVVNYTVTATDNCAVITNVRTSGLASGSAFPLGASTVTWTATDAAGNSSTCSFTVTVLDGQLPVITPLPVNSPACVNSNRTITVVATNAVSYQWQQFNGTTFVDIPGATSASLVLNNVTLAMSTNTYRVRVNGLCTSVTSGNTTLVVNRLPTISIDAILPPSLLPTQSSTLTATVSPTGGTIMWFKNGVAVPGATALTLTRTVDDQGTYYAIYTDGNGCTMRSNDLVISPLASDHLYVYPNPNSGIFDVRFFNQSNEAMTVRVFSSSGQMIFEKGFTTTLPWSSVGVDLGTRNSAGIYIVEVVNSSGQRMGAKRIIVRHP